jgi:predicted TIM-barrel fold metal-dependent hydrolase
MEVPMLPSSPVTPTDDLQNYAIISSDGHAGADVTGYKPYLEQRWHDEFDEWARVFRDPWKEADPRPGDFKVGVSSTATDLNWNSSKRNEFLEADGVCAEVLFPNTAPPFYPTNVLAASSPTSREDYERRWAGLRAHNRWMVDFCAELPGRRAGIAQLFLFDVEDAVEEIRWAARAGLMGGVLLPADHSRHLVPYYRPEFEPVWATCAELGVPINKHSNISGEHRTADSGIGAQAVAHFEGRFFWHRVIPHLIFAGVFERYPDLRLAVTETGMGWVPGFLSELDAMYAAARRDGSLSSNFAGEACRALPKRPSEYFAVNCFIGASLMTVPEVSMRYEVGTDRIMFGSDLPHGEGTYPFTRQALRMVFADVEPAEVRRMVTTNACEVYGFDQSRLETLARAFGPSVEEVARPLDVVPRNPEETVSPVFAGRPWYLQEESALQG